MCHRKCCNARSLKQGATYKKFTLGGDCYLQFVLKCWPCVSDEERGSTEESIDEQVEVFVGPGCSKLEIN